MWRWPDGNARPVFIGSNLVYTIVITTMVRLPHQREPDEHTALVSDSQICQRKPGHADGQTATHLLAVFLR